MRIIFLVNRSIDGIYSSLYESFTKKIYPEKILAFGNIKTREDDILITPPSTLKNNLRVKNALIRYAGDKIIEELETCILSTNTECFLKAFKYAYLTLKIRANVSRVRSSRTVSDFYYIVNKVLKKQ